MALSRLSSNSSQANNETLSGKKSPSPLKNRLSPQGHKFDTFNSFHNQNDRKTGKPLKARPK